MQWQSGQSWMGEALSSAEYCGQRVDWAVCERGADKRGHSQLSGLFSVCQSTSEKDPGLTM